MAREWQRGVPSARHRRPCRRDRAELDHDELRERMSGNLCRCGAYNGIVAAIARRRFGAGGARDDAVPATSARHRRRAAAVAARESAPAPSISAAAPTSST